MKPHQVADKHCPDCVNATRRKAISELTHTEGMSEYWRDWDWMDRANIRMMTWLLFHEHKANECAKCWTGYLYREADNNE